MTGKTPIIRINEKTGEKKAGFLNCTTGEFEEVANIKNDRDIDCFMEQYEIACLMVSRL